MAGTELAHPLLPEQEHPDTARSRLEYQMERESLFAPDDVLRRVRGEFLEMPGLRLTEVQARRLWNLDAESCHALLKQLVDSRFLFRTRDGAFMRLENTQPLRASLRPGKRVSSAA